MKWVQGRMWPSFRGECDPCFCVAGAIVSEPQKDFFHPRESYSRVMRRSSSHFNQLPGHYGCYGVPLLRCNVHFEQLRRCPQVPPKGSPVPLNAPLSPGLTLKGWVTYWIERQVTICPQVPLLLILFYVSTQCFHACWHVHLIHIFHAHLAWLKISSKPRSSKKRVPSLLLDSGV